MIKYIEKFIVSASACAIVFTASTAAADAPSAQMTDQAASSDSFPTWLIVSLVLWVLTIGARYIMVHQSSDSADTLRKTIAYMWNQNTPPQQ